MAVPYTFATATSAIPLSQLDNNFATAITMGNTAVQLGNTITTLNNMTLANVTVSSGNVTGGIANASITNAMLANSTATIGNTTVTLGSTSSSIGNLTLNNVSITSGNVAVTTANATTINATTLNAATHRSDTSLTFQTNGTTTAMTVDSSGNMTVVGTLAMSSSFLRNRIINGNMATDQRNAGASQTITAAAALAYTVDRWYAYSTGANVTGQRVQGASANQYRYQFTGAASVTAIGFAQRIEAINSADLAGSTATLSVDISNSLLTTVTWTAYYANTTDTFGTLASPTVTSIATGSFTVTSTVTRYNAQISIPSAATTGLQIVFTVGAQTSGAWVIGNVQLEPGSVATPFERRQYGQELVLCQRYCFVPSSDTSGTAYNTTTFYAQLKFPVVMRANPTSTYSAASNYTVYSSNSGAAPSAVSTDTAFTDGILIKATGTYVLGAGGFFRQGTTVYSAEL